VVELVDGSLYMNMRSRRGKKQRAYSFSRDSGQTWSAVKFDARLPEPSCQGSIIRLTSTSRFCRNRILLCHPSTPAARTCLTVRVSYDECRSWPVSKVLYSGPAAYSDLAVTADGRVLCLFEANNPKRLLLARFEVEWLTDGKDSLARK
jgi:sialidase-1